MGKAILFYYPTSKTDGFPEPPQGLGHLMTIAGRKGFDYDFYDEDHHSRLMGLKDLILKMRPGLYAVSCMTPQYYEAIKAIKLFKSLTPEAKVIIGGPHASALPEQTLEEFKEVDFLCKGEGEKTFEEFLDFLAGKRDISSINGLYYRKDGRITGNPARGLMNDGELDTYPVDWEKILSSGQYPQKLPYTNTIEPVLPIITTRGCPYECTFCNEGTIWNRKVRMRSIDNVVEEVSRLSEKFNVRDFDILDDTFTLKKDRVAEFCEKIAPLGIRFRITAKPNTVNEKMLEDLKRAGCKVVAYGVESGDETVLKTMKKRQTLDNVRNAFELTKKAGMLSYALCMVGNIGEDMAAVKKTAAFIQEIKPDLFSCAIMTPYPGSENYRICKENGWIRHYNWEYWVPSALKTRNYQLVSITDKMDEKEMIKAYYFMNRSVLMGRFKRKYGAFFPLSPLFYRNEVFPRFRTIGPGSFLKYFFNIFLKRPS